MLSDFVAAIANLAKKAQPVEEFVSEQTRQVVRRTGDGYHEIPFPPVPREGALFGLEDFVAAVLDGDVCKIPEVWHGPQAVLAFVDRGDRHDKVVLALRETDRFGAVRMLARDDAPVMNPKELLRVLRHDFAGSADFLIPKVRKVDFSRTSTGSSEVRHGSESLGRKVEAAVQGAEDIPERFTVEVPVYGNHGLVALTTTSVTFGITIHHEPGPGFEVRPLADQVANAEAVAQVAIGELLRARLPGVPVFYGAP